MKRNIARCASWLLVLSIVIAFFAGTFTVNAASNNETRGDICTSLSSQAVSYYTGSYSYDSLSRLQGGTSSCLDTVGSALFDALHDLMADTMTNSVSYSSLTSYWPTTDGNLLFYSDFESTSYNREHVWPKSHASFEEKNGGCDLHHLRPTNSTINSTRNNLTFGNVKDKTSNYKTKDNNGKVVLWYSSSYASVGGEGLVEVLDNVKGDVARILLYVYVRWEEPNLFEETSTPVIGPSDKKNDGLKVIEDLDTLLEWMLIDPVDTWEMERNDQVQDVQGNRNVFIDYPELAWLLFGEDVPANMSTPSGGSGSGSSAPSCNHPSTEIRNASGATCTSDGYTGDTHCAVCGKRLSSGTAISAPGHKDNNGDNACDACGKSIASGTYVKVTNGQLTSGKYVLVTAGGYAPDVWDNGWLSYAQPTISGDTVTDPKGAVWTLTVSGSSVTLTDSNGVSIAPKGGNNNGIASGSYSWAWSASNGGFIFKGTGSDTVRLAQNTNPDNGGNRFRAYKESTATGSYASTYPSVFTLYKLSEDGGNSGSGGSTPTCTHSKTEVRNASGATCTANGYTGDIYCKDCGAKLSTGTVINATGHKDANTDNKCDVCGASMNTSTESTSNPSTETTVPPTTEGTVPPTTEGTVPPTTEGTATTGPANTPTQGPGAATPDSNALENGAGIWIIAAIVVLLGAGVVVVILIKKKKS